MDHLDFEARSAVSLKQVGAWAYALHPSTEITVMAFGRTPSQIDVLSGLDCGFNWGRVTPPPMFSGDGVISAHNAPFEYAVYNLILHRRFGWPARWDPALWSCTMARAAQAGLPLDLDTLSRRLHLKTPKDVEGRALMLKMCAPEGYDALGDPIYRESPEDFARLCRYCAGDVRTEMEADDILPQLAPGEKPIWDLDLAMNRRGVQIDLELARNAARFSEAIVDDLNERLRKLTNGAITKASRIAEIKKFLLSQGVAVPTKYADGVEKETLDKVALIETLQKTDLPPLVRAAVEIRQQVGKATSTAKYSKALEVVSPDGRARGSLQYHAAHTGRWGGRAIQPQNFPKGFGPAEQAESVSLIKAGDAAAFINRYGTGAMNALSDTTRGLIVAPNGKVLVSADFNAIEARTLFWEAGDEDALATYRRGESPYVDMANYIYRRTDITKKGNPQEYDIGKRTILGCGFGMGAPKFKESVYVETAKTGTPVVITPELAQRAVKAYREKYATVPRLWKEMEAAAMAAVANPRQCYAAAGGKVLWGMSKDCRFLVCRLPSGRYLWYWKPEIVNSYRIFCKDDKCVHWAEMDEAKCPTKRLTQAVAYWGQHPKTNQWVQILTYGGMLVENVTQAIARDIMAHAMLKAEAAGFTMVLTVHDELLAEAPAGTQLDSFTKIMCDTPSWAAGLPVLAEGWIGDRYRK